MIFMGFCRDAHSDTVEYNGIQGFAGKWELDYGSLVGGFMLFLAGLFGMIYKL